MDDVTTLIDVMLSGEFDDDISGRTDINGDGITSIDDIVEIIDIILNGEVQITLTLSQDTVQIYKGDSIVLVPTVLPEDFAAQPIKWFTTDSLIAVVSMSESNTGCIMAVADGECEIVAECNGVQTMCHVEVLKIPIESISLNEEYVTLQVGENLDFEISLIPSGIESEDVVWSSSDEEVATVSNGEIIAVAPGVCNITAQCQDQKAICKVVVMMTIFINGVSFNMMPVEGGTFMMGSAPSQPGSLSYEKPQHQVTLSSYMIGQTEVTQELWGAVMGHIPGRFKGHPQHPVENVTWEKCDEFISLLNELTGLNFHLPTEAQWEYAARGGNRSHNFYFSGSNSVDNVGWFAVNSASLGENHIDFGTHDVATKAPNELNLYDMSGNVSEWCMDWYVVYTTESQTDPHGPSTGSFKVYRGGSWNDSGANCRVTFRYPHYPSSRNDQLGLRLAL